ncbi:MAG TPA: hypothetical protein VK808_11595 [Bacteroidia bacterium]|jgi:hypothetical protein|nr:hypothetical protein [Bacteroidia bacterium]
MNKHRFIAPILHKSRVIFFDLEFYVPVNERNSKGLCYNPFSKDCLFITGAFLPLIPSTDFELTDAQIASKIQIFNFWEIKSEKNMVKEIYDFLRKHQVAVKDAHNGMYSPLLCGIGIASSDIPILFELIKKHQILQPNQTFQFQNNFRTLDLSQLSIASFKPSDYFLYPKSKKEILKKYLPNKNFKSGKSVWELYEQKDYQTIEERIKDEVLCTYLCYKSLKEDFEKINL